MAYGGSLVGEGAGAERLEKRMSIDGGPRGRVGVWQALEWSHCEVDCLSCRRDDGDGSHAPCHGAGYGR